jgi:hypothetical protein
MSGQITRGGVTAVMRVLMDSCGFARPDLIHSSDSLP